MAFDIVTNDVAVRSGAKSTPFEVRLAQGVADTNAEGLLGNSVMTTNAALLFQQAGGTTSPIVIRSKDDGAFSALSWPPVVRGQVERDLEAGNVVVIPRASARATAVRDCVWWRVNPRTGQSLGMGGPGWGQSMTEKAVIYGILVMGFFDAGALVCMGIHPVKAQGAGGVRDARGAEDLLEAGTGRQEHVHLRRGRDGGRLRGHSCRPGFRRRCSSSRRNRQIGNLGRDHRGHFRGSLSGSRRAGRNVAARAAGGPASRSGRLRLRPLRQQLSPRPLDVHHRRIEERRI